MAEKELNIKKYQKKWKIRKDQIIKTEDWTLTSLIEVILELRAFYLEITSHFPLNKYSESKKKVKEFMNQIIEVLGCLWYCQELHLYYLLFPYDVKEQSAYITTSIARYKQYIADHHYLYLSQQVREDSVLEFPIGNLEEVLSQAFLSTESMKYAKARFYAIDLLIAYLDKVVNNPSLATVPLGNKMQWARPKKDLCIIVFSLAKTKCFTCSLGKPLSAAQLAGCFEQIVDIDLEKNIYQTINNISNSKVLDKSIFTDLAYWIDSIEEDT
ncbi:hypothetical protein HMPREF9713_01128 [Myroides odoratimimus CCUG 12700]|uniref:hypothetical protein n=1 Tax=Myroides odoratimimus TaxID=76832 RepID=UPI0003547977|nr:hypothetical protein [Myroides odoratimimus]EPH12287.1 hypothetical protein HMPREF9713_01128 [Myroides odoratimimus CCUG 12700]